MEKIIKRKGKSKMAGFQQVNVSRMLDFNVANIHPDSGRKFPLMRIGDRNNELDVTMTSAETDHFDPVQCNLNVIGANPVDGTTINTIYQLITHDTTAMTSLRLKCADWNIAVGKNIKDAYVYQGEIDITAGAGTTLAIGGEAAVLGLVMNAGSTGTAVTGNLRGVIISMQGTKMPAGAMGIEIRCTCTTALGSGISIAGTPQATVGIAMGNQTNHNEGPVNAFYFPTASGADVGPCVAGAGSSNSEGSIKIKVGTALRYLRYYAAVA